MSLSAQHVWLKHVGLNAHSFYKTVVHTQFHNFLPSITWKVKQLIISIPKSTLDFKANRD